MNQQPDVNQGAMRPAAPGHDGEDGVPGIDRPPRRGADVPLFDEATAAEETQREDETLEPGTPAKSEQIERKRQSGAI
jgi:hypothetical protein